MKITRKKIQRLIKEELEDVLEQAMSGGMDDIEFARSNATPKFVPGLKPGLDKIYGVVSAIEAKMDELLDKVDQMNAPGEPMSDPDQPPLNESKTLRRIIDKELNIVLEQLATFRQGLQQRSDFERNQADAELMRNIESKTKQELFKLISRLKGREDSNAKRYLKVVMDGFPYNLKDGAVSSIEDLEAANTADPTPQPSTGD